MATASDIFSAAHDASALPNLAATALADEPGQMCLVSLIQPRGGGLRPVALAHRRPSALPGLRTLMSSGCQPPADAFSREVLRTGRALRVPIGSPRLLRLWFPDAYWPYVERLGVCALLAAALRDRDRILGALLLWREHDQPPFNEVDQAYVVSVAARLAVGLGEHPMDAEGPGRE